MGSTGCTGQHIGDGRRQFQASLVTVVLGVSVDSSPRCGGFLPHLLSRVHRQKQLEVESGKGDFVSTKRFWTLPESGRNARRAGSGVARFCEPRTSRKTIALFT